MKKELLIGLCMVFTLSVNAQKTEDMRLEKAPTKQRMKQSERHEMNEEKRKEIEAQKVAYITTQLKLTPEESKAFWPIYNEHQEAVDAHRKKRSGFKKSMKNISELSDQEVEELLKSHFTYEREAIFIEEKYFGKFKQVLPIKKVAAFYDAERGFKKELLKSLRGNGKGRQEQHPGKGQ